MKLADNRMLTSFIQYLITPIRLDNKILEFELSLKEKLQWFTVSHLDVTLSCRFVSVKLSSNCQHNFNHYLPQLSYDCSLISSLAHPWDGTGQTPNPDRAGQLWSPLHFHLLY